MKKEKENVKVSETDVVILCGGMGKRLKSVVSDRPKPLVDIGDSPFIEILVSYVARSGFRRFIFCTGYRGDMIENYFKEKNTSLEFSHAHEKILLGTGGALKNAGHFIKSDTFLALNGDSFCDVDFVKFMDFHLAKKADVSIVLTKSDRTNDYGLVAVDDDGRITAFKEKQKENTSGLVNAGIYLMKRNALSLIPPKISYSIEYDLFDRIAGKKFFGYIVKSNLIDIGTPSGYEKAKKFLKGNIQVKL